MQLVDYQNLNALQREQLLDIEVSAAQKDFSGDMYSALYTLVGMPADEIRGFALLVENTPRAFMLVKRGKQLAHWAQENAATLHALQVDHRYQGRGLGRACLAQLPAAVLQIWPALACLQLSVDAGNSAGVGLYQATGWVDTGEGYRGRMGYERRMTMTL